MERFKKKTRDPSPTIPTQASATHLLHGDDAGRAHEVDAVVHVPHTGGVGDLVLGDDGRLHQAHGQRELPQGAVVLGASEEPVVRVAHLVVHDALPPLGRHVLGVQEGAAAQLLRLQRLAVLGGRGLDGALDDRAQRAQEELPEVVGRLLQEVHGQRLQLLVRLAQLHLGRPQLALWGRKGAGCGEKT